MDILAIVNPISGGVNKEAFLDHFKSEMDKYGIGFEIFNTTGNQDEIEVKEKINDFNPDKVISVGGDGTTLFTACALMNTDIPFGIIPMGSANGMATEVGIDEDPRIALSEILKSNMTCPLDLIIIDDKHYCLHIGDVGINADIVEGFSKDENRGMGSYIRHFLQQVIESEPFEYRIETDGKTHEGNGYMVAIANSRKYGTGVVLNYEGNPTDGKFEVVVLKDLNPKVLVKAGLSRFNDELARGDNVQIISCERAKISLRESRTLQLDGEVIGEVSNFEGRIIASAVNIVTTGNNPFV